MPIQPLFRVAAMVLLLAGCKPSSPAPLVSVELSWTGASAEQILEQLPALGPGMKLALIDDGRASLYFQQDISKTDSNLKSVSSQLPEDMRFSDFKECSGSILDAPKSMKTSYRRHFQIIKDAPRNAGVSLSDLSQVLKSLPALEGNTESTNILEGRTIKSNDGANIPLTKLVDSKVIMVSRPLIFENR